jgi:predicted MPP superfamily phosphohydrolase
MIVVFLLVVLGVLGGVHWYLWRRLVRDTTAPGGVARRIGTAAALALPLLVFAALVSGRVGVPFTVQRVLAWSGYLWLALMLYLTMALVVGEAVRPLLRLVLERMGTGGAGTGAVAEADPAAPGGGNGPSADVGPGGEDGENVRVRSGATRRSAAAPAPLSAAHSPGIAHSPGAGDTPGADGRTGAGGALEVADALAGSSRRLFVARTVALAASAVAAGTVGYGTYGVLAGPGVKRVTVPLAKLPRAGHGFRIAVVSDIHLGPVLGRAHTQRIVDRINATQPDLIAVVGDLADGSVADLGPAAEPLARLRARHGAYFVTGNHEYFSGAAEWVDHVRELGLRPLENARTELPAFELAGVNDLQGESEGDGPDYEKALGDRDRSRAVVLLAHQPVMIHDAVEHGVDLQLSGHTHGGQLWPGNHLAALANPTVAGLERYGDTQLYVTRGAGAWGPPVRVGAPSDITVVELASQQV